MFDMFPDIDEMDLAIQKADASADVRKDKYDEAIRADASADVRVDK